MYYDVIFGLHFIDFFRKIGVSHLNGSLLLSFKKVIPTPLHAGTLNRNWSDDHLSKSR